MKKEEILAKSREEKIDEGILEAENRGRKLGYAALGTVFIFIILFNISNGRNSHAPMAMFWAYIGAESYSKYSFTKEKGYLVATMAGAIASIFFLVNYALIVLR